MPKKSKKPCKIENKSISLLKNIIMMPFKDRTGERFTTNEGYEIEIIECFGNKNCTIKFNNGCVLKNVNVANILKRSVRNPYHPSTYGIGYLGQGKYATQYDNVESRLYRVWRGMFYRCYSAKGKENQPTYIECSVDERWHNYQIFAQWYEDNFKSHMQDWQLDKDILVKGNKIYSIETCCFVPQEINTLFAFKREGLKGLPVGVVKLKNRFVARLNGVQLGSFLTIEEAFHTYKTAKEKRIKEVACKWKPHIEPKVYDAVYNYKITITE